MGKKEYGWITMEHLENNKLKTLMESDSLVNEWTNNLSETNALNSTIKVLRRNNDRLKKESIELKAQIEILMKVIKNK